MTMITQVTDLAKKEAAAETARGKADANWRAAWWKTTLALGSIPQSDKKAIGEAQAIVRDIVGGGVPWTSKRTRAGRCFVSLKANETVLTLMPRMAVEAVESGAEINAAMVKTILKAEADGVSIREFRESLTGKPWTNIAENLTESQQVEIAEKVLKSGGAKKISSGVMASVVQTALDDENVAAKVDTQDLAAKVSKVNHAKWQKSSEEQYDKIVNSPAGKELDYEAHKQQINGTSIVSKYTDARLTVEAAMYKARTLVPALNEEQRERVNQEINALRASLDQAQQEITFVVPDYIPDTI